MATDIQKQPSELHFYPLDIRELAKIKNELEECDIALCDYTPGGLLFGIRELYRPLICRTCKSTVISVLSQSAASREFLMPLSFSEPVLDELFRYSKQNGDPLVFDGLTEDRAKQIAEYFGCGYETAKELYDYVYDARALAYLEGSAYQTQRTNIRKLERRHFEWSYARITEKNKPDAIEFANELFKDPPQKYSPFYSAGVEITYDSLRYLSQLGFCSGMLYVDGRVAGIAVGSIKNEMLYIHVLRADRNIWGAWNLLCREFVLDNLSKIKYVNMEDDLNDVGIRRMKRSYAPIRLINRCRVKIDTK